MLAHVFAVTTYLAGPSVEVRAFCISFQCSCGEWKVFCLVCITLRKNCAWQGMSFTLASMILSCKRHPDAVWTHFPDEVRLSLSARRGSLWIGGIVTRLYLAWQLNWWMECNYNEGCEKSCCIFSGTTCGTPLSGSISVKTFPKVSKCPWQVAFHSCLLLGTCLKSREANGVPFLVRKTIKSWQARWAGCDGQSTFLRCVPWMKSETV